MSIVSLEKNPFAPYFARFTRPELAAFISFHHENGNGVPQSRQFRAAVEQHARLVRSDLRSFIRSGR